MRFLERDRPRGNRSGPLSLKGCILKARRLNPCVVAHAFDRFERCGFRQPVVLVLDQKKRVTAETYPTIRLVFEGKPKNHPRFGICRAAKKPREKLSSQDRGHKSAGSIRAPIGVATNFPDIWRFLRFIAAFRDQTRLTIGDVTFDIESGRIIRDVS